VCPLGGPGSLLQEEVRASRRKVAPEVELYRRERGGFCASASASECYRESWCQFCLVRVSACKFLCDQKRATVRASAHSEHSEYSEQCERAPLRCFCGSELRIVAKVHFCTFPHRPVHAPRTVSPGQCGGAAHQCSRRRAHVPAHVRAASVGQRTGRHRVVPVQCWRANCCRAHTNQTRTRTPKGTEKRHSAQKPSQQQAFSCAPELRAAPEEANSFSGLL